MKNAVDNKKSKMLKIGKIGLAIFATLAIAWQYIKSKEEQPEMLVPILTFLAFMWINASRTEETLKKDLLFFVLSIVLVVFMLILIRL